MSTRTTKLPPVRSVDMRTRSEKAKQERYKAWAERYNEYAAEYPNYAPYRICSIVAKEFGATPQGINKRLKAMGVIKAQA